MTLVLQTQNVILRDWRYEDLLLYEEWLQPGQRWQESDGPYEPSLTPVEIDEQIARISTVIESGDPPTPRRRLVISLTDGGEAADRMIGTVSADWEQQASQSINLGISIFDPAYWRQGIGYCALGLWTQYLFDELPALVRLGLRTWSGNVGMVRLAQKLGFQEEMRLRQARIVNDTYFDAVGYGVLRTEWLARYPRGFGVE
ncbi:MAG: GNAT family protein [Caldilineaceae bacterium]